VRLHRQAAIFSKCRRYRYVLSRCWDRVGSTILFVGLNPSTADEQTDDATVRRCVGFAKKFGYGKLLLANLFAYRTTTPSGLKKVDDPVGPDNDDWLCEAVDSAELTVVAWGMHGALLDRASAVLSKFETAYCLGTTKDGFPRHPLYLPANSELRRFRDKPLTWKTPPVRFSYHLRDSNGVRLNSRKSA